MLVFLSYRRDDCTFAAQCLKYALRLAGHEVFLDTGAIAAGEAFREVIRDSFDGVGLVLALVGPAFDPRRLHEPGDPVAFEWRHARFRGCVVHPVLVDGAAMPSEEELPSELRWFCTPNATTLGGPALGDLIDGLVAAVPDLGRRPRPARRVLWVDDHPGNNERERRDLRQDGIVFDNVVSTTEALELLDANTYHLVITDLGRWSSSDRSHDAGLTFLGQPVLARRGPPIVVYAWRNAVARRAELEAAGAFGVADGRGHLYDLVRRALQITAPC